MQAMNTTEYIMFIYETIDIDGNWIILDINWYDICANHEYGLVSI
jgi:hypothetical protein